MPTALLLPAGQLAGVASDLVGEAHQLQDFLHPGADVALGDARDLQRVRHVSEHRAGVEEVELLKDHADALAVADQVFLAQRGHVGAVDHHPALVGRLQAVDQPDHGGLPPRR